MSTVTANKLKIKLSRLVYFNFSMSDCLSFVNLIFFPIYTENSPFRF